MDIAHQYQYHHGGEACHSGSGERQRLPAGCLKGPELMISPKDPVRVAYHHPKAQSVGCVVAWRLLSA